VADDVVLCWYLRRSFCGSVISQEAAQPSAEDLGRRDGEGMYSAEEPFWATLEGARYLTAADSDRVVCPFCYPWCSIMLHVLMHNQGMAGPSHLQRRNLSQQNSS
jgi:hypothetical protein